MNHPLRRELDLAGLAARERRLRLVMQILSARQAESEWAGVPAPAGLRQSISDFGRQLGDVHRRQAELNGPPAPAERHERAAGGRTDRFARRAITHRAPQPASSPRPDRA